MAIAPARLSQEAPSTAALAGTPSIRQRSLELEATALRAELGLARLEAELLRHECHKQFVELGTVQDETATPRLKLPDLPRLRPDFKHIARMKRGATWFRRWLGRGLRTGGWCQ